MKIWDRHYWNFMVIDNELNQVTDNKTIYPSEVHEIHLASFESYFGERNGKYF